MVIYKSLKIVHKNIITNSNIYMYVYRNNFISNTFSSISIYRLKGGRNEKNTKKNAFLS